MLCPPKTVEKNVDVLVIGGGLPGVCAALEAAAGGAKVAILEREQTLGGNCGPALGVHASDGHRFHPYMASTGVVGKLIEDAAYVRAKTHTEGFHYNVSHRWDIVMSEALRHAGVEVLRRHYAHTPEVENGRITAVWCEDTATYKRVKINVSTAVIDDSGDGHISERAGAEYRMGREAKSEYGERLAPDEADSVTMGASLVMLVHKTDHPVPFIPPEGTPEFHPGYDEEAGFWPHDCESLCFLFPCETGGDIDTIEDYHEIYHRLEMQCYAVWDRIKNKLCVEESKNWDILWISPVAGKRESRRFLGDYVLTQTDCEAGRIFEDAIAVGGFAVDIHYPRPENEKYVKVRYHGMPPVYSIPYRCIYSKDIENLFFASRLLSVSHMAHGSVRLQRTLATIGQAAGAAAAMCMRKGVTAREIYTKNLVPELQQILIGHDATVPGVSKADPRDLAPAAQVHASSEAKNRVSGQTEFVPMGENSGVELWNFGSRLDSVEFRVEADAPCTLTARAYRWAPERKYQLRNERVKFDFERKNEADWGNVYGLEKFALLGEASSQPQNGRVKFDFGLELAPKDIANDDDRVVIIVSGGEGCKIAVSEAPVDFAKLITGLSDGAYTVKPGAPDFELTPEPAWGEGVLAISGTNRRYATAPINMWRPTELPASLELAWPEAHSLGEVRLTLDSLTRCAWDMPFECNKQASAMLAKKLRVGGLLDGEVVSAVEIPENHNRVCTLNLAGAKCDRLRISLMETWEGQLPGIYDIRVYEA